MTIQVCHINLRFTFPPFQLHPELGGEDRSKKKKKVRKWIKSCACRNGHNLRRDHVPFIQSYLQTLHDISSTNQHISDRWQRINTKRTFKKKKKIRKNKISRP